MDERSKCEKGKHQNPRGEHSQLSCTNLLNMLPKARKLKAKMNYWDLMKIKTFCTAKETINKTKGNRWKGRCLQMTYWIKG